MVGRGGLKRGSGPESSLILERGGCVVHFLVVFSLSGRAALILKPVVDALIPPSDTRSQDDRWG